MRRRSCRRENRRKHPELQPEVCTPATVLLLVILSLLLSEVVKRRWSNVGQGNFLFELNPPSFGHQQKSGESVQTPTVNSQPLDNILRVVTVVELIMTELNGAV
jgi:hypothetical protein